MREIGCILMLLSACTSQTVRCDGRLEPINRPLRAGIASWAPAGTTGGESGGSTTGVQPRRAP